MSAKITFPQNFLWGSASASHQVEGNNYRNQWWEFEQKKDTIKNNDKSGIACDHYNRYEEDFQLLKNLNHNAHRLSFEWSRFFPESPDKINNKAVEHYHKVLENLINLNIEPFVTAFHFTIPQWFAKMGGFQRYENIKYFEKYIKFISSEYKEISYWNTINEPFIYSIQSYFTGEFPPGEKNLFKMITVIKNLLKAHSKAYHIIKNENPESLAGIVKHMVYVEPKNSKNPFDKLGGYIADWIMNGSFIEALKTGNIKMPLGIFENYDDIKNSTDFIGLNYYTRIFSSLFKPHGNFTRNNKEYTTQMGWTIYPEGLYHLIMRLSKELNLPIYITENGIATLNDNIRVEYIKNHLKEVHKAINNGTDVKGYFYWSNLDNFEWAEGFEPKFGIIEVDKENNLKRTVKNSGVVYSHIIKNNGFSE